MSKIRGTMASVVALAAVSVTGPALAQETAVEGASDAHQEIIVTAQRREQRLVEVPISVAVLDGEQLDVATLGLRDTLNQLPAVNALVGANAANSTYISIRGASGGGVGGTATGFYLDGVSFGLVRYAYLPNPNVYDLDRIEVLRGPQGTLFGSSSVNGIVRVFTHDANLNAVEAKAQGTLSSTQTGGVNWGVDGMVNAPLIEGKLAVRLSGSYAEDSGFIDRPNKRNFNDGTRYSLRMKVNAAPTERLRIGLSAWTSSAKANGRDRGFEDLTYPVLAVDEPQNSRFNVFSAQIGYEFDGFNVESTTSYIDYDLVADLDYYSYFTYFGAGNPFQPGEVLQTDVSTDIFTQELTLASSGSGPWRWTAGAIYRNSKDYFHQVRPGHANPSGTRRQERSESYAVFGELTRSFFDDRFELTAGLRYFEDHQKLQEISRLTSPNPTPPLIRANSKFDYLSKRFVASWKPDRNLNFYASYGEGFRSGYAQEPVALVAVPTLAPVREDVLKNYEIGAKGQIGNGLLSYEIAGYFIDWQDVQQPLLVTVITPTGPLNVGAVVNGESASGLGFEASATLSPAEGLRLNAGFAWSGLEVDSDVRNATNTLIFAKGDRLGFSPEYTVAGGASYNFPLGGGHGSFSVQGNYFTGVYRRLLVGGVSTAVQGDDIFQLGARLSFEGGGWTAALFADNLTNERGAFAVEDAAYLGARYRPRTVGIQLGRKF